MRIPAHCSLGYLLDITQRSAVDYCMPERQSAGKTHFDILELLSEGLDILTDATDEKIDEHLNNPYINYLRKNFRIKPSTDAFINLRSNERCYFENLKKGIGIYLLTNTYKLQAAEFERKMGYHVMCADADLSSLFDVSIETFKSTAIKEWRFALKFLQPHHSMIIADPYVFKEASRNSIRRLYESVTPKGLVGKYHLTIIGSDQNRKSDLPSAASISKWKNAIENWLVQQNLDASVEAYIYNREDFHDRYLITNNTCIFSGYGLDIISPDDRAKRDGTWIGFKPFSRVTWNGKKGILYYDVMLEKLEVLKKWATHQTNIESKNPLFKLVT